MKTGFSMFSFQENADIEKLFPLIRKAGYDGVEPVLSENGYLNHKSTEKDILTIKKLADDVGLEIPSVGVWSLWDHNLVSNNSKVRQEAKDIILKSSNWYVRLSVPSGNWLPVTSTILANTDWL